MLSVPRQAGHSGTQININNNVSHPAERIK